MNLKIKLKDWWTRYKAWQLNPFDYSFDDTETHQCANCEHEFIGTYCHYCGQKYNVGRITWNSIWQEFLNVWGIGGRSMLYSLWQLLWRPGYFISDYISGKRQVSFPPVKMMFIFGLFYLLLQNYLLPDKPALEMTAELENSPLKLFFSFEAWSEEHHDWGMLIVGLFLILPTWIIFRLAPKHTRHGIPEGFFIQVLMCILIMMLSIFSDMIPLLAILQPIWLTVAYKQLFGYGWWGSIWRTIAVFLASLYGSISFVCIFDIIQKWISGEEINKIYDYGLLVLFSYLLLFHLAGCDIINHKPWKKFGWWGFSWRTLIGLAILGVCIVITLYFVGTAVEGA